MSGRPPSVNSSKRNPRPSTHRRQAENNNSQHHDDRKYQKRHDSDGDGYPSHGRNTSRYQGRQQYVAKDYQSNQSGYGATYL